ncbi:transporter substrate-binding domain-containing protein [Pseudomonas sp. P5_C3]
MDHANASTHVRRKCLIRSVVWLRKALATKGLRCKRLDRSIRYSLNVVAYSINEVQAIFIVRFNLFSILNRLEHLSVKTKAFLPFGLALLATCSTAFAGATLYAEPNVVAIEKGDPQWNAKVTEVVTQLKADGTLSKISQKWIGADISQ